MRLSLMTTALTVAGFALVVAGCDPGEEDFEGPPVTEREAAPNAVEPVPGSLQRAPDSPQSGPDSRRSAPDLSQQPAVTSSDSSDKAIKDAQQALKERGHEPGRIDGVMSTATRQALRQFQEAEGLEVTGQLDESTRKALGLDKSVPRLSPK